MVSGQPFCFAGASTIWGGEVENEAVGVGKNKANAKPLASADADSFVNQCGIAVDIPISSTTILFSNVKNYAHVVRTDSLSSEYTAEAIASIDPWGGDYRQLARFANELRRDHPLRHGRILRRSHRPSG